MQCSDLTWRARDSFFVLTARSGAGSSSAAAAAPAAAATEPPLVRRVSSRESGRPGLAGLATQSTSARRRHLNNYS